MVAMECNKFVLTICPVSSNADRPMSWDFDCWMTHVSFPGRKITLMKLRWTPFGARRMKLKAWTFRLLMMCNKVNWRDKLGTFLQAMGVLQ